MVSAPNGTLSDGVVLLRPLADGDLPVVERGINDPDVIRSFGRAPVSAGRLLELNRRRWSAGTAAAFAVCDIADECLGEVWVNLTGAPRGIVGGWLLPEARGRGLATRALRLISCWAFREAGLARLRLLTEASNRAAQRVAERGGFRREGVIRSYKTIGGRRTDGVVYSLLAADLESAGSSDVTLT